MDMQKLNSPDRGVVYAYVRQKFRKFNGLLYSRKSRVRKCSEYYAACQYSPDSQIAIEHVYQEIFGELFDADEAMALASKTVAPERHRQESTAWQEDQEALVDKLQATSAQLKRWKDEQRHQMGEDFLSLLEDSVSYVDASILDVAQFSTQFSAACRQQITSATVLDKDEVAARMQMMVGFEQSVACRFDTAPADWGVINAKLEESFRAGLWGEAKAGVVMKKLNFTAEVQAAIAIGAQLNVAGELKWSKGRAGLVVGGAAEAFVGAKANAGAKLSMDVLKGLEASIKAGAFVGFSAQATGSCTFSFDGRTLAKAEATAGVTFGVGASLEASIKAPIFGPTKIAFGASLSAGFGTKVKTAADIHFDEVSLAMSQQFRELVYWRTMARGYEMTLINSDARNLYYLNKAILRVTDEIASVEASIASFERLPLEKRPLLK